MMAHSTAALIKTSSSSAADQGVADALAGSLWGVSMGTTSQAAAYGNYAVVAATNTRMSALEDVVPEGAELTLLISGVEAFTNRSDSAMFWSLLGAAEGL